MTRASDKSGQQEPDAVLVEAIARRVVELLRGEIIEQPARFLDAAALARELGVERDWVYEHAEQLGAIRLGGPKGRLRFDRDEVSRRLGGADAVGWRPPRRPARRARPAGRRSSQTAPAPALRSTATAKSGRGAQPRPRPDTGR